MTRSLSIVWLAVVAAFFATVSAECPNACSAHGKCGAYDMCTCYRNWMASDCSERICQFGMAHVDIPKGDLDASGGALSMNNVVVNDFIYPYGTTELYASQTDVDGNVLTNTAHEYRECSAKGICDRSSGICSCFEGYEGSACQRASCPVGNGGVCSGHGTCRTISEIANLQDNNVYKLWDEDTTMGCVCDGGYEGPDCSQKKCKYGVDPLYFDNNATIRYSNWTYGIYTLNSATVRGNYSLVFFDSYGEDWQTDPIPWNADCDTLTNIIESLPNQAVPAGSVLCYKSTLTTLAANSIEKPPITESPAVVQIVSQYTIAFSGNPGKLKQIQINPYLDGTRPTLFSSEFTSTLGWYVYPNGFIGEDTDYVHDRCAGVTVNVAHDSAGYYLTGFTSDQARLLKACLGDANGDDTDNVEVYNWDYGTLDNPHLVKLQDATQYNLATWVDPSDGDLEVDNAVYVMPKTLLCANQKGNPQRFFANGNIGFCANPNAPGFYAVLYYNPNTLSFRFITSPGQDYSSTTPFFIYTTPGFLRVVSRDAGVFTTMSSYSNTARAKQYFSNTLFVTNTSTNYTNYFGDMSCENYKTGTYGLRDCLNRNDLVMILDPTDITKNPAYPNLYTVTKVSNEEKVYTSIFPTPTNLKQRLQIHLDYSLNVDYRYTGANFDGVARVYKFYPKNPSNPGHVGGYTYAGPCSLRGTCNGETGLCECFNGYTGDSCNALNALAK